MATDHDPSTHTAISCPLQLEPAKDTIELWLDAVESASDRSRWLTIVLTIAGILTVFAYWNSRPDSWILGRAQVADAARHYLLSTPSERYELLQGPESRLYQRGQALVQSHGWDSPQTPLVIPITLHHAERESLTGSVTDTGALAIDLRVIAADRYAAELERERIHKVMILDVPFLGIIFDINDLGLLAGVAFTVILMMRKMNLRVELGNLSSTFRKGLACHCLRETYEIVVMRQVLTVPHRVETPPGSLRSYARIWAYRVLPGIAELVAPVILTLVYVSNWESVTVGAITNPLATQMSLTYTLVFLVSTYGLTLWCWWSEWQMHRLLDCVITCPETRTRELLGLRPGGE